MHFMHGMFGDSENPEEMGEALRKGCNLKAKLGAAVLAEAKPYLEKGQMVEAAAVVHAAVWSLVAWAKLGVDASEKMAQRERGRSSPVKQMWEVIRIGLTADNEEEAERLLEEYRKQQGWTDDE